jgi:hypothetical protein
VFSAGACACSLPARGLQGKGSARAAGKGRAARQVRVWERRRAYCRGWDGRLKICREGDGWRASWEEGRHRASTFAGGGAYVVASSRRRRRWGQYGWVPRFFPARVVGSYGRGRRRAVGGGMRAAAGEEGWAGVRAGHRGRRLGGSWGRPPGRRRAGVGPGGAVPLDKE